MYTSHNLTLAPAGRGRGQGEGAGVLICGPAHLTFPRRRRGPLPLPPEGRRGAVV